MPGVYDLPALYPDELWCSALARYHLRSGNPTMKATLLEIGAAADEKEAMQTNTPYASKIMMRYFETRSDEAGFLNALYQNTLEPFSMRYIPAEKKRLILRSTWDGCEIKRKRMYRSRELPNKYSRFTLYCPECVKEDIERFGEPYWHRQHQILTAPVCLKHRCRLVPIAQPSRSVRIMPPSEAPESAVDRSVTESELEYAKYVKAALDNPFDIHEEPHRGLIVCRLIEGQYITIGAKGDMTFTTKMCSRLLDGMKEKFGHEFVEVFFHYANGFICQRFRKMFLAPNCYATESYLLIAAFLGVPCGRIFESADKNTLFGGAAAKLEEMSKDKYVWRKDEVMQRLGVTAKELSIITKATGIRPCWSAPYRTEKLAKKELLSLRVELTGPEKERIQRHIEELGIYSVSEYVRYCIRKEMEESSR